MGRYCRIGQLFICLIEFNSSKRFMTDKGVVAVQKCKMCTRTPAKLAPTHGPKTGMDA